MSITNPVAQSVASGNADPGFMSLIPAQSLTFVVIDLEIFSMVILIRVGVSYKQKYVHKVLVNHLVKFAQEKVWLG